MDTTVHVHLCRVQILPQRAWSLMPTQPHWESEKVRKLMISDKDSAWYPKVCKCMVPQGHLSRLCLLPTSHVPQPPRRCGNVRGPWHSAKAAQQWQNLFCITTTIFSTNPKHSLILASMEKMNSATAKTSRATFIKCPWIFLGWESIIFYTDKTFFIPKV